MKLACVLISHLAFHSEAQRRPELRREPVIVVGVRGSRRTVVDFSPWLSGVQRGMPLQTAVAAAKNARLLEADDAYYQAQFSKILDALAERSPEVEASGLGCAYVGMDGLEELFGGDARLVLALQSAVPGHFNARLGVGQGKFVAYLAALSAEPGRAFKIPPGIQNSLNSFSVDVLPVNFSIKTRLHRFALHTLRDIAAFPPGALQAQFGLDGKLMWELANGIDERPLIPRETEEVVTERLSFAEPVVTLQPILLGAEILLGRAFLRSELRGRYARLVDLQGHLYMRATWDKQFTFKEPVGDVRHAMTRIKGGLENTEIPSPLEDLSLSLKGLTGEPARQGNLFPDMRRHEQIQQALRQLDVVLGKQAPVYQVREVEPWSRIPERRHALVPVAR